MRKIYPFGFYFLYFAALASMMPFVVLYYREIGLNGAQIGLLTFLWPLVTLVGSPLWTGMADARRSHRALLSVAIAGVVALAALFPALRSFAAMLVIAPLFAFFLAPIIPFTDSATVSALAAEGKQQMYGRVRLGGTLGWAIFAPVAGALVEAYGIRMAWWSYAALMAVGLVVAQGLRFPGARSRISIAAGMRSLVADRRWAFFLAMCFVAGMGFASINNYLYAYMQELGAPATLMGIALTVSTLSEIPIMFFANRLLARLGARTLFVFSVAITGVRLLLYALFPTPGGVLAFQLVNGFTFPLAWIAGVAWANENAPAGMEASAQGMFGAMVMGVGAAAGGLLTGILFGAIGGRNTYFIFAGIVLAGVGLLSILERSRRWDADDTD